MKTYRIRARITDVCSAKTTVEAEDLAGACNAVLQMNPGELDNGTVEQTTVEIVAVEEVDGAAGVAPKVQKRGGRYKKRAGSAPAAGRAVKAPLSERKCEEPTCGKTFQPKRIDSRFCTGACSIKFHDRIRLEKKAAAKTAADSSASGS